MADKVRENLVRRMAHRQGLRLEKSRRRDPLALDYGTYALVNAKTGVLMASGRDSDYGLTIDQVEQLLKAGRSRAVK